MKKKKNPVKTETPGKPELSGVKKRTFYIAAFSIPVIFIIVLELSLRIFNYGGNLDLFIEGPPGYEEYLRCNPNVARRYFAANMNVPTPPKELFLKQKPAGSYRIFVLGGSTTAGFPYGNNVSFPNVLGRALNNSFPGRKIEVVNVAMSTVNTYTLVDFLDEIYDQSPDALLVYAGHNEFYGALGVGSVQSVGNSRWLIRTYLDLQSFKTMLLLKDFIDWFKTTAGSVVSGTDDVDGTNTLMARIVGEQTIPYKSDLYNAGKDQFAENMKIIIESAKSHGVKIVISELVSNVRNQKPFISINSDSTGSADNFFRKALLLENYKDTTGARKYYKLAKDYDALRFRAPEEFNEILRKYASEYSIPVVPMESNFEKESSFHITGEELILEHLHPNIEGYFLMAKGFYDTMKDNKFISDNWPDEKLIINERNAGITELDSVYGKMVIDHLKQSWPFKPRESKNRFFEIYHPKTRTEEIAFKILPSKNYNIQSGHVDLGKEFEKEHKFREAFEEYNALITSIPTEIGFYKYASTALIENNDFEEAKALLEKSLEIKKNEFAYKWIGQIELRNNNYPQAIAFLGKSDLNDPQVVFNLSRSYYFDGQFEMGEKYFSLLKTISQNPEYIKHLSALRKNFLFRPKISK